MHYAKQLSGHLNLAFGSSHMFSSAFNKCPPLGALLLLWHSSKLLWCTAYLKFWQWGNLHTCSYVLAVPWLALLLSVYLLCIPFALHMKWCMALAFLNMNTKSLMYTSGWNSAIKLFSVFFRNLQPSDKLGCIYRMQFACHKLNC